LALASLQHHHHNFGPLPYRNGHFRTILYLFAAYWISDATDELPNSFWLWWILLADTDGGVVVAGFGALVRGFGGLRG